MRTIKETKEETMRKKKTLKVGPEETAFNIYSK